MKRGILLVLTIVLLSSFALATVNLKLDQDKFGPEQNLQGTIEIQMENPLPIGTDLQLIVDGKTYTKNLSQVFELIQGEEILPQSYESAGSSAQQTIIEFAQAPYEKLFGIDLSDGKSISRDSINEISSFTLKMKGDAYSNVLPDTPALDIGNDNSNEYSYIGSLIVPTKYQRIDPSTYLGDETIESENGIRGNQQDIYCQEIKIHPSQKFKVEVNVKKNIPAPKPLKAAIVDLDVGILPDCSVQPNSCCTLNGITGQIQTKASCEINSPIIEEKDYLVCLFITDDTQEFEYNLGADTSTANKQGFYGLTQELQRNFFIYVSWAEYNTKLSGQMLVPDLKDKANEYLQSCNDDDCLLMPIKVSTKGLGKVTLDNIKVIIDTIGSTTITSLKPISFLQERIKYPTKFTVPLSLFENAITPKKIDEDYSVKAVLATQSSETKRFDVTEVSEVEIDYSPYEAELGDVITFTSIVEPVEGRTIKSYAWDFNNSIQSTSATTTYTFTEAKEYTIKLTVTDSSDLKSTTSIKLSFKPLTETLESKLNSTAERIKEIKTEILTLDPNVKAIYDLMGYNTLIEQSVGNITLLQTQFASIDKTSNTANAQYATINQKLTEMSSSIPDRVGTSKVSFNSKITSLDEVNSALELGEQDIEQFKEKVYLAQQSVSAQSDASLVKIQFLSGSISSFIFVKKIITGTGSIYDIIPQSLTMKEVLTPNYEIISPSIYKWSGTSEISYILEVPEGLESTALTSATESKTLVIPLDLASVEAPKTIEKAPIYTAVCGDGICSSSEDSTTCSEDCKAKKEIPWVIIIILVLIVGIGIYYFNFYKGPHNFQEITGGSQKPKYFKTQKDADAVIQYIKTARQKGMLETQIRFNLRKKGWKEEQLEEAFKWSRK